MSTEAKEYKSQFYYTTCILILSAVVVILVAYIFFFTMFGTSVQSQLGWESSSNAIGLVGLVTSVITVVFVYKAYKAQSEELKQSKRDTEFNRAIEIIYRHYDHNKTRIWDVKNASVDLFKDHLKFQENLQGLSNQIGHYNPREISFGVEITREILRKTNNYTIRVIAVTELFSRVINNNQLIHEDRVHLNMIVFDLFYGEFTIVLERLTYIFHDIEPFNEVFQHHLKTQGTHSSEFFFNRINTISNRVESTLEKFSPQQKI